MVVWKAFCFVTFTFPEPRKSGENLISRKRKYPSKLFARETFHLEQNSEISISKSHEMSEVKAEMTNRNCFFLPSGATSSCFECHFNFRFVTLKHATFRFFSPLSSMHSIEAFSLFDDAANCLFPGLGKINEKVIFGKRIFLVRKYR